MSPAGTDLLAALASGVRTTAPTRSEADTRAAGGPGFADLLHAARSGAVSSGLPVEIESALGLELSDEQRARLELAADRATSEGAERAVVVLDGKALVLDVEARRVIDAKDLDELGAIPNVDAVIGAAAPKESEARVGLAHLALHANASVTKALGINREHE
ncbi:MAG: hypothetical protein RIB60_05420 [Phycisphaerales bacterium]